MPEADLARYAAQIAPGTISAIDNLALVATGAITNTGNLSAGQTLAIQGVSFRN